MAWRVRQLRRVGARDHLKGQLILDKPVLFDEFSNLLRQSALGAASRFLHGWSLVVGGLCFILKMAQQWFFVMKIAL